MSHLSVDRVELASRISRDIRKESLQREREREREREGEGGGGEEGERLTFYSTRRGSWRFE